MENQAVFNRAADPVRLGGIAINGDQRGATTGDLSARRGHITGTRGQSAGVSTVTAIVPLSELKDYLTRLKSLTGGQGSYSIELSHYEPAPVSTQIELMKLHNLHAKDEEE